MHLSSASTHFFQLFSKKKHEKRIPAGFWGEGPAFFACEKMDEMDEMDLTDRVVLSGLIAIFRLLLRF